MTAVPLPPPADAYNAYGANLEAGLEGDISQPAAARGSSADRYGSEEGEEQYDFRAAAWSDEEHSDWAERANRSGHRRRRGWRDEPSATVYVRVCTAAPLHIMLKHN